MIRLAGKLPLLEAIGSLAAVDTISEADQVHAVWVLTRPVRGEELRI